MEASEKAHGRSGGEISAGRFVSPYIPNDVLGGDYNSDWTVEKIRKMLSGSGQIGAVRNAIDLALMQSDFSIVPYKAKGEKDPSKEDLAIAQFVEKNWDRVGAESLDCALDAVWYGFALFEPIHRVEDGQIVWDRFTPYMPWTVSAWHPKDGHVGSVDQYAYDHETGQYTDFTVQGKDLLRFTNRQRGMNFEGSSFLRQSLESWTNAKALSLFRMIYFEKYAGGLTVGALPPDATSEQEDAFKEILPEVRTNEASFLYLGKVAGEIPIRNMIDILVPDANSAGPDKLLEHIQHEELLIARSMLTHFLNYGESNAGTRALSNDSTDMFLMNLEAISGWIARTFSRGHEGEYQGVKALVDLNFKNVRGYPRLKCGRTKKTDAAQILAVTAQLVQSGAMRPDDTLEDFLRGHIGAPQELVNPREVKTVTRQRDEQRPGNSEGTVKDEASDQTTQATEQNNSTQFAEVERRDPFPHEQFVAFEEIERGLDRAEADVVQIWRDIFRRQLDLVGQEFDGQLVREEDVAKIPQINMPLVGELASRLERVFKDAYRSGQSSMRGEIRRQLQSEEFEEADEELLEEEEAMALIAAQASSAAQRLSDKVKGEIQAGALLALGAAAVVSWQQVRDRAWMISDGLYARPEGFFVDSAFGMGRNAEMALWEGQIAERYYSALMDMDTCDPCAQMDGMRYSEMPFVTPNPNCLGAQYSKGGGNPCRCLTVVEMIPQ